MMYLLLADPSTAPLSFRKLRAKRRPAAPEVTAMAAAFLKALERLDENRAGAVTLPTGTVTVREVAQVVKALKCARRIS